MIEMCTRADGFDKYLEHFTEEKERLSKLLDFDSIDDFVNGINFEFGRLPAARNVDVGLKETSPPNLVTLLVTLSKLLLISP